MEGRGWIRSAWASLWAPGSLGDPKSPRLWRVQHLRGAQDKDALSAVQGQREPHGRPVRGRLGPSRHGSRRFPHSPPPPVLPISCSVPWLEAELVEGGSTQLLGITAGWELRGGQANLGHSSDVLGVGETALSETAHWELWAVIRLSPATDDLSGCS